MAVLPCQAQRVTGLETPSDPWVGPQAQVQNSGGRLEGSGRRSRSEQGRGSKMVETTPLQLSAVKWSGLSHGDRSQDTNSRARQVAGSPAKSRLAEAKGRTAGGDKRWLLPGAASGLIPGAVRRDCILSGAHLGLVLGTRGRCLCGLRSPCYRPVGWGFPRQWPLLPPHPVHRRLTGRPSTSHSDALLVWALLDLQCPWFS